MEYSTPIFFINDVFSWGALKIYRIILQSVFRPSIAGLKHYNIVIIQPIHMAETMVLSSIQEWIKAKLLNKLQYR
jgi:hypothetical protein